MESTIICERSVKNVVKKRDVQKGFLLSLITIYHIVPTSLYYNINLQARNCCILIFSEVNLDVNVKK